jgi:hypothetical protein
LISFKNLALKFSSENFVLFSTKLQKNPVSENWIFLTMPTWSAKGFLNETSFALVARAYRKSLSVCDGGLKIE